MCVVHQCTKFILSYYYKLKFIYTISCFIISKLPSLYHLVLCYSLLGYPKMTIWGLIYNCYDSSLGIIHCETADASFCYTNHLSCFSLSFSLTFFCSSAYSLQKEQKIMIFHNVTVA